MELMTTPQEPQDQNADATLAPDFFAISPRGGLVMGYNVPLDIVNGPAEPRLAWTQQRLNVCMSAIEHGYADQYAAEYAEGREYSGYEIAFLSPLADKSMEKVLAESQKTLPRNDVLLLWENTASAAPEAVRNAERSLAEALRPLSEKLGTRVVLWAVLLGDQRQAGVVSVPADGGQPVPYNGELLPELEELTVTHKLATYMVEGRTWVSLLAHCDAQQGYYVEPQFEKLPAWVPAPSDEDWAKEREMFPVVNKRADEQ